MGVNPPKSLVTTIRLFIFDMTQNTLQYTTIQHDTIQYNTLI